MAGPDLKDYVDVATRIQRFYEKYPEGSLQSEIREDDGKRIVVIALAFRNGDDTRPCIGHAEEIRGQGMVNRTSALENAETSAWGRALAAAGLETTNGIASREEMWKVQRMSANQAVPKPKAAPKALSTAQAQKIRTRLVGADVPEQRVALELTALGVDAVENLTATQAQALLEKVGA